MYVGDDIGSVPVGPSRRANTLREQPPMGGISISFIDDQLVAIKRATDQDGQTKLAHEASILTDLRHPGVVRFVDHIADAEPALITTFVGPETWAERPPATGRELLQALAELSAIVADIHSAGVCHGDLRAEHVLIDGQGHPVLCGFGLAQPVSAEGRQQDRQQLDDLARSLVTQLPTDQRRPVEAALPAVADTDQSFRQAIRILDAHASQPQEQRGPRWRPSVPRPRLRTVIGAGLAAAVALFGLRLLASAPPTGPVDTSSAPLPTPSPTLAPPWTQPPGDLQSPPATVVNYDGRRYAVGSEGDQVALGDWTCDGQPTPAVLRPSTGEVMIFDRWPEPGRSLDPASHSVIADAFEFVPDSSPCPELRVRTATGSQLITIPRS